MEDSQRLILELFDLPGASTGKTVSPAREEKGKDAGESVNLGLQCLEDGDFEGALGQLEKAMEQGAPPQDVLESMAAAYEGTENLPQAINSYLQLRAAKPSSDLNIALADTYARSGQQREALQSLEDALKAEPENAYLYFKLAEKLRAIGQREKSLEPIDRAIEYDPQDSFYRWWKADVLLDLRRPADALAPLQSAIELDAGDDKIVCDIALAFWGAGETEKAIRAMRLATDLDPESKPYKLALAKFLELDEQTEEAHERRNSAGDLDAYDRDLVQRHLRRAGIEA
jgi:tetratricopeptide (TPR) repeat protein